MALNLSNVNFAQAPPPDCDDRLDAQRDIYGDTIHKLASEVAEQKRQLNLANTGMEEMQRRLDEAHDKAAQRRAQGTKQIISVLKQHETAKVELAQKTTEGRELEEKLKAAKASIAAKDQLQLKSAADLATAVATNSTLAQRNRELIVEGKKAVEKITASLGTSRSKFTWKEYLKLKAIADDIAAKATAMRGAVSGSGNVLSNAADFDATLAEYAEAKWFGGKTELTQTEVDTIDQNTPSKLHEYWAAIDVAAQKLNVWQLLLDNSSEYVNVQSDYGKVREIYDDIIGQIASPNPPRVSVIERASKLYEITEVMGDVVRHPELLLSIKPPTTVTPSAVITVTKPANAASAGSGSASSTATVYDSPDVYVPRPLHAKGKDGFDSAGVLKTDFSTEAASLIQSMQSSKLGKDLADAVVKDVQNYFRIKRAVASSAPNAPTTAEMAEGDRLFAAIQPTLRVDHDKLVVVLPSNASNLSSEHKAFHKWVQQTIEDMFSVVRTYMRFTGKSIKSGTALNHSMALDSYVQFVGAVGNPPGCTIDLGKDPVIDTLSSVFKWNSTNKEVFAGILPLLEQSLTGATIMLGMYGHSGAGKTFTMFGDAGAGTDNKLGVAQQWIEYLLAKKATTEKIVCNVSTFGPSADCGPDTIQRELQTEVCVWTKNDFSSPPEPEVVSVSDMLSETKSDSTYQDIDDVDVFQNWIDKFQKRQWAKVLPPTATGAPTYIQMNTSAASFIRPTPFNENGSSRVHTAIHIQVMDGISRKGGVVLLDLAGVEDIYAILQRYGIDKPDAPRNQIGKLITPVGMLARLKSDASKREPFNRSQSDIVFGHSAKSEFKRYVSAKRFMTRNRDTFVDLYGIIEQARHAPEVWYWDNTGGSPAKKVIDATDISTAVDTLSTAALNIATAITKLSRVKMEDASVKSFSANIEIPALTEIPSAVAKDHLPAYRAYFKHIVSEFTYQFLSFVKDQKNSVTENLKRAIGLRYAKLHKDLKGEVKELWREQQTAMIAMAGLIWKSREAVTRAKWKVGTRADFVKQCSDIFDATFGKAIQTEVKRRIVTNHLRQSGVLSAVETASATQIQAYVDGLSTPIADARFVLPTDAILNKESLLTLLLQNIAEKCGKNLGELMRLKLWIPDAPTGVTIPPGTAVIEVSEPYKGSGPPEYKRGAKNSSKPLTECLYAPILSATARESLWINESLCHLRDWLVTPPADRANMASSGSWDESKYNDKDYCAYDSMIPGYVGDTFKIVDIMNEYAKKSATGAKPIKAGIMVNIHSSLADINKVAPAYTFIRMILNSLPKAHKNFMDIKVDTEMGTLITSLRPTSAYDGVVKSVPLPATTPRKNQVIQAGDQLFASVLRGNRYVWEAV